jgi:hypothetical protein
MDAANDGINSIWRPESSAVDPYLPPSLLKLRRTSRYSALRPQRRMVAFTRHILDRGF